MVVQFPLRGLEARLWIADIRFSLLENNYSAYCTVSETEVVCCVPLAFPVIATTYDPAGVPELPPFPRELPQAACSRHPPITRKTRQKLNSFLRPD
jgi:hypothetical protein